MGTSVEGNIAAAAVAPEGIGENPDVIASKLASPLDGPPAPEATASELVVAGPSYRSSSFARRSARVATAS